LSLKIRESEIVIGGPESYRDPTTSLACSVNLP
jgi:hypothetical protein